jgi:sirohydrochlorin cobaltochelatase
MQRAEYADATLLILAHGSTANAESASAARQHAVGLRGRRLFADVRACFWKQAPGLLESVTSVGTPRLFVVPLFMGPGYFVDDVFPVALGLKAAGETTYRRRQQRGGTTLYYAHPVGTHPAMTAVVLARARDVAARHPFPHAPRPAETALFIAGHGTERTPASRIAVERQVELIRQRGEYAEVHPAFMEDEPRIAACYDAARARNLVMVPFFISDGLHSFEDIPVMLGEPEATVQARFKSGQPTWINPTTKHGKRVWYTPSIGTEPHIADVILERVREQAGECANGGNDSLQ